MNQIKYKANKRSLLKCFWFGGEGFSNASRDDSGKGGDEFVEGGDESVEGISKSVEPGKHHIHVNIIINSLNIVDLEISMKVQQFSDYLFINKLVCNYAIGELSKLSKHSTGHFKTYFVSNP